MARMTHGPWRTLIADDERIARRGLRRLVESDPDFTVVAECRNGREVADCFRDDPPDLAFLDIQMPVLDGLSCLSAAGPERAPVTVIVSAYPQYAIGAFDARAVDYLVKPFSDGRLFDSLSRAKQQLALRAGQTDPPRPAAIRIGVRTERGLRIVAVDDIDWIEADDYESLLHVRADRWRIREPLASLEHRLDPAQFVRVHRSAMVNIARVVEVQSYFHGSHILLLSTGSKITLARRRREAFERILGQRL
jgi:two-component system, LytTR family, response regulator